MKAKIVFLCSALAASSGAAAEGTGLYGGIGMGKAKATLERSDFTFNIAGVSESKDEITTAYKFFAGYQFIQYIAAEISYTDFGKFGYIYDSSGLGPGLGTGRLDYKAKSWALSGVGSIPIGSSGFSALARLGIAYNTAERSALQGGGFTTNPVIPSATKRRVSPLWGAGGQYDFSPSLGVRLEYEDYGKFGEAQKNSAIFPQQTGRARIHMYALSLLARF